MAEPVVNVDTSQPPPAEPQPDVPATPAPVLADPAQPEAPPAEAQPPSAESEQSPGTPQVEVLLPPPVPEAEDGFANAEDTAIPVEPTDDVELDVYHERDDAGEESVEDDAAGLLVKEKEKDNEWLQLSSSDSEELFFQYETITKPKKKWMGPDTSYESQNLGRALTGFMRLMGVFGRIPFTLRTDDVVGLLLFSIHRYKSIPFRATSIIIWIIFVLCTQSLLDILYGNEDAEFAELESAELRKFQCVMIGFFVSLAFVAIFSIAFILDDGFHICQYMNFIAASITKFQISATRRVKRTVVFNTILTCGYCLWLIVSFYLNEPKTFRGACEFFAQLVARPFGYRIRVQGYYYQTAFEVAGLLIHLYCYISMRFVFTHMHVMAVIIGNLAKNWNFRFGLCFAQFGTQQKTHLFRLHFGESLMKLFNHHRLVCGLARFYGSVFALPFIMHYVLQIAVVATILVILFFSAYQADSTTTIPIPGIRADDPPTIMHNTLFENMLTASFVLAHFTFEFVLVSEQISSACSPVMNGFEFVRRHGLMRCRNTHEVRLIMSLQWSMSAKNPALVNINNFFYVNRPAILSGLGFSLLLVSLVIQLKQVVLVTLVLQCTEGLGNILPTHNFSTCYYFRRVAPGDVEKFQEENAQQIANLILSAGG